MQDVDNRGTCVCGKQGVFGNFVLRGQFFYKLKTALN